MLAWGDNGTRLPEGCAALRLETNWVRLLTVEQLASAEPNPDRLPCTNPAQMLCRALRMAPASYRRFEIAVAWPDARLEVEAAVFRHWDHRDDQKDRRGTVASFSSAAELAAAMQQYATAERLTVHLSADQQDIIVRRAVVPPADAVDVRRADVVTLELDYLARYKQGERVAPAMCQAACSSGAMASSPNASSLGEQLCINN